MMWYMMWLCVGMGKRENGRLNPIQAPVRGSQSEGLGFGKKSRPVSRRLEEDEDDEDEDMDDDEARQQAKAKKKKQAESNWRKSLKPQKKMYMDASQLIEANEHEANAKAAPQVVIDMTGRNVRMTTLDKLGVSAQSDSDEDTAQGADISALPELQHNVRLLVEMTEGDIMKVNREKTFQQDSIIPLEHERERLQRQMTAQKDTLSHLQQVQLQIKSCEDSLLQLSTDRSHNHVHNPQQIAISQLQRITELVEGLRSKHMTVFRDYHLVSLIPALAYPILLRLTKTWDPLVTPILGPVLAIYTRLKFVLEHEEDMNGENAWLALLEAIILPKLQLAIGNPDSLNNPNNFIWSLDINL